MVRAIFAALLLGLCRGFEVLNVGAPRTGTQTMNEALQKLGYRTLHSGYESWSRAPVCDYLFSNGSLASALKVLDDYDAAMDEPFHLFYNEVMEAFPQAKFVLTISEPERWYQSYVDFVADMPEQILKATLTRVAAGLKVKRTTSLITEQSATKEQNQCSMVRNWGCEFDNPLQTPEIKQRCLAGYNRHNARVQEVIPADRLLVFNLTDGWPPLANFLGKSVPNETFPYVDKFHDQDAQPDVASSFLQHGVGVHRRAEL